MACENCVAVGGLGGKTFVELQRLGKKRKKSGTRSARADLTLGVGA